MLRSPEARTRATLWAYRLFPILLLPLMLLLSRDFGVTWDEKIQQLYGERVWRFLTEGLDDDWFRPGGLRMYLYGGLFDTACVAAQRVLSGDIWVTRHYVNAAFGWLGVVYVGRLGRLAVRAGNGPPGDGPSGAVAAVPRRFDEQPQGPPAGRADGRRAVLPDAPGAHVPAPRMAPGRPPHARDRPRGQRAVGRSHPAGVPGDRAPGAGDRDDGRSPPPASSPPSRAGRASHWPSCCWGRCSGRGPRSARSRVRCRGCSRSHGSRGTSRSSSTGPRCPRPRCPGGTSRSGWGSRHPPSCWPGP